MAGPRLEAVPMGGGHPDYRHLRDALGRFPTGVTVVTTRDPDGRPQGVTVNSFAAVSLEPPLVLWSLRRAARSSRSYLTSGIFAVNVLADDQEALARRFAAPQADKFAGLSYTDGRGGCPLLEGCLARFECVTVTTVEGGDHVIFIGRIEGAAQRQGEPLIFSAGRYLASAAQPVRERA